MRKDRRAPVIAQPGATAFSDDRSERNQRWVIRMLKAHPEFYRELDEKAVALGSTWARRREPGSWALAYLAFVAFGKPDIEPWWKETGDELWLEAGFDGRPPYERVWTRFTELEQIADAFQSAAGLMIRHARKHSDEKVGRDVHVDSTAARRMLVSCMTARRARAARLGQEGHARNRRPESADQRGARRGT